ncbi:hypothetical protein [Sinorhizobium medicae]|uniref:hypothetical protein n=1 Tax=Sinorhizobium medicae TaxID=110321 RepID=UPI0013E341A3|nr:hypothetical protein [Sinorhizobium medicae]
MLATRKPEPAAEREERPVRPAVDGKPAPATIRKAATDARESLDEPNALFWHGIWMTLF